MSVVLKNQKIWLDAYDLSGQSNQVSLETSVEMKNNSTFGDDTRSQLPTVFTASVGVGGLDDVSSINSALFGQVGGFDKAFTVAQAATEGSVCHFFKTMVANYNQGGSFGDLLGFDISAGTRGRMVRGTLMENNTGISATGAGTARQLGAVSASQKIYAALHVLGFDNAADSLIVTVESDATNSFSGSETTRATFTVANGLTSEVITADGAITDTWWRVTWAVTGSTPSFDFVGSLGIL